MDARGSIGAGGEGKASGSLGLSGVGTSWTTSSSDDIRDDAKEGANFDHKDSAELSRQYQFSMDKLSSFKFSETGGTSDSTIKNLVENTTAAYDKSLSDSQSFTEKQGVVEALQQDASYMQSHSASIKSNLDSEFVDYVQQVNPAEAKAILSDLSNPELTRQREQLYQNFTAARVNERIEGIMNHNTDKMHTEYQHQASKIHSQIPQKINNYYEQDKTTLIT